MPAPGLPYKPAEPKLTAKEIAALASFRLPESSGSMPSVVKNARRPHADKTPVDHFFDDYLKNMEAYEKLPICTADQEINENTSQCQDGTNTTYIAKPGWYNVQTEDADADSSEE